MEKFNEQDWIFEMSSGYAGYRNRVTDEWIYEREYVKRMIGHEKAEVFSNEFDKCLSSPYYFATTYLTIKDESGNVMPFKTRLTEEEFNQYCRTIIGRGKM